MASRPTFRMLGSLEVEGVDPARLGGPIQRAMLAYLLLHPRLTVTTNELVDAVWGDDAPATATAIVHGYVRRIRELIAATPATVRSQAGGYRLDVPAETIDTTEFDRLISAGHAALRDGRAAEAARSFGEALALWRGEPFDGLGERPFLTTVRSRLGQARLAAQVSSVEARLLLGESRELIPDVASLSRGHPHDESVARLLMLALYRSGGQSEALGAYRELRHHLAEDLGIEPSMSLQELEAAILRHDPSLDPAHVRPATFPPRPGPPIGWLGALGLTAIVVSVAVAGIAVLGGFPKVTTAEPSRSGGGSPQVVGAAQSSGTALYAPGETGTAPSARIVASWSIPQPSCCGIGSSTAWGVGHHDDRLREIDTASNRLTDLGEVAGYQSGIPQLLAGSVWIPSARGPLVRFDPGVGRVVSEIPVASTSVAFGDLDIWATTRDHHLDRVNLATNEVAASIPVGTGANEWDDGLAISTGAVWDSNGDAGELLRIDPASNRVVARVSGFGKSDSGAPIAYGEGSIWLLRAVAAQMTLFRIDVVTNRIVAEIPVGPPTGGNTGTVAVGGGYAWTATWDGTISQIDPRTNTVVRVRSLPAVPQNISFGDGSLWVDGYDAGTVWRIDALN